MISITSAQNKLFEVDEILLEKRQHYSANFLDKSNGDINVYEALRYIFESYLEWTPIQVRDMLNADIIRLMRMEALVNRVPCPPELDRLRDFEFVAWFLYPETKNCNDRDLVIKVYQRLLTGEISRFPKGFFDGTYRGWFRARVAFQHMLIEFLQFRDLEHLYAFFAGQDGKAAIRQYKLLVPLRELYDSPLDYLHDSLNSKQKSEALYQKHKSILLAKSRTPKTVERRDEHEA